MNKKLITFFTILFCLTSLFVRSETMDELVERDGIYYKRFSDIPFTGKINLTFHDLIVKFEIKNGKKNGSWFHYYKDGQLKKRGYYIDGMKHRLEVYYYKNGELFSKGDFKYGNKDGSWVQYYDNRQLWYEGDYKNGREEGSWVYYYKNGQLKSKGEFTRGFRHGLWIGFHQDGTVDKFYESPFKNGVKVSD